MIKKTRHNLFFRVWTCTVLLTFAGNLITFSPSLRAQAMIGLSDATAFGLPAVGTMITSSPAFTPVLITGIKTFPDNPLRFDFIVDPGDTVLKEEAFKQESEKLIKYFLASLTVPEEDLWVNLSPYEADRVIPHAFGETEMGRDLLAQDYLLKQLTSSLMYPEDELGEEFWTRIYKKAHELFGTTEIPVNTFNKVWIVPEKAVVYVNGDNAFVVESSLKVMLEHDYLAAQNAAHVTSKKIQVKDNTHIETDIIREVILPAIEQEVNEGTHFANLRQIYHSMILATWFKRNLVRANPLSGTGGRSPLQKIYIDQNKTAGVDIEDKEAKEKIYNQYVEAFKTGVYNYIKEDYDPATQTMIPRKYFSGGFSLKKFILEGKNSLVETMTLSSPLQESRMAASVAKSKRVAVRLATASPIFRPIVLASLLTLFVAFPPALAASDKMPINNQPKIVFVKNDARMTELERKYNAIYKKY